MQEVEARLERNPPSAQMARAGVTRFQLHIGERVIAGVVLLDRSGSMGGWKITAARRATARLLDALTDRVLVA